jgi:hypothetical protein
MTAPHTCRAGGVGGAVALRANCVPEARQLRVGTVRP